LVESFMKTWVLLFLLIAAGAALLALTPLTDAESRIVTSLAVIFGVLVVVALFAHGHSGRRR
jgi:uncharacterized membrane protein YtjA (UPF0391 family)